MWSTIYGGSDRDRPVGIETDIDNNVYIIGRRTKSPDLPVFDPGGGAHFSGVLSGVNNDGESYLLSFDNNGVRRWATYLGIGPGGSDFSGLTIDEGKNIYVSGMLYGGGLPIVNKPGSYNDATYNGGVRDMGIMEFDPNFNLTWSSYMGGNDNDHFEFRMASDILPCGDTVIAILGRHNSPNFPTVDPGNNAYYDPSMVGFGNSGIVRFIKPDTMEREPIDTVVCNATSVLLDAYEPNATYVWQDGSTDSVYLATTSDTFWVDITLRCCTYRDTFIVEFLEPPKDIDTLTCAGQNVLLDATVLNATYSWQDGSTNATYNAGAPGIYWVDVDVGNCIKRDTFEVVFYEDSTYQISSCAGSNSTLIPTYTNATSYLWQDGSTGSTFNAINNGTYYVDMVINGCNLTDTFHVTQFIASAKIDTTVCPGSSVFLNVYTVGATYSWHDGSIQPFYNANNSGFYWVDITLGSCTVRDSFEVTISQVLIPQYFDSLVCPDSSVLFDATSAGAVGYLWNDGSTLASFQADTAGIYTVEIDFGNCIRKDTFELKYVALSSGNNFNMQLCPGQLVFLYANPNNATYSWQDGTSNQFNTVTQQGVYWVDISLNGCTKRDSFDVAFTVVPSGIFVDTSVCQGQAVTFDATDPSATSYTWDNGTTLPTFNTSIPGIYWVDKTINGCDVRDTFSLSLYSDQVIDSILCPGNTMTLSATTSPATAYLWSDGTSNSSIQINSPGTYWVDVTISGCTYRDTFNVITIPAEMKTDSSICTAGNIILDAYLPGATYVWQNGSTNPTLSVNSTGIYWVDISLQGCSKRDSFDIIYTQAPQGVYIDTLVCQGQNVNLDATDINATGYSWNDGSSNPNLNVAVGGIYWVDKSMNTGCIIRDTFELSYQSNQIFDTVICTGQQITLQASSQTASSYTWHDGTTASTFIAVSPGIYWVDISESGCTWRDTFNVNGIGLGQVIDTTICLGNTVILDAYIPGAIYLWSSGSTNPSLLVNANGTYFVDVSINGCTKTDTFHVTTITTYQGTTTDTLICVGGSLNMFASNTSGSNYLWQNGNTGISDVANGPGVYWVNYMINGCITADTFIVSNHPLNQGDIYDVELCPNQILLLYGSPSNALYTWNDGNTDQFFTVSDSGVYWVDVEVDKCTKRDSFIVTHANVPEPFAIDTFICYQDSIQISAFDNNALSYLWYDSTTLATGVIDSVGTFWVEIDYGICVNRNFYNVFYQSQPLKLASDTIVICKGESYVLIPNIQGSNYEWQDGSTNSSYEVTEEGVYWVNVFDGCAFSADTVQFLSDNCNCQMHMPTGFSPDADGLNDIFKPEFSCDVEPPYTFRVFNRWGDLLFETDNPDEGWDGNYIGTPVQMGVYIWRLEYSMDIKGIREDFEEYGKITILRNGKGE
ncbi:MAG: gliding motility-associated C-terminal domain-containing protein [Flavobacteriales bacterium]|nr:gliding motility-associated C-terminal domain-containing protein [Flavobacteriales bacterium]